jgi:hypothetical protein
MLRSAIVTGWLGRVMDGLWLDGDVTLVDEVPRLLLPLGLSPGTLVPFWPTSELPCPPQDG